MRNAGIAILSLIPCFWLQRIQAGDLASHVYNSWLSQLIERGQAPGLFLATPWTNVLFDLAMEQLGRGMPIQTAAQITTAAMVLVFVFGAQRLLAEASSPAAARSLFPTTLMLAYGWTFHQGLLNFQLSLGIVLWALSLIWRQLSLMRFAGAGALMLLAATANPLPVAWGIACWTFVRISAHLSRTRRLVFTLGCILAVILLLRITPVVQGEWAIPNVLIVPADQFFVYGLKYRAILLGMTVLWSLALLHLSYQKTSFFLEPTALLFATCLVATFLLPRYIRWGNAPAALAGLQERMTLPLAIVLLLMIGQLPLLRWQQGIQVCLAALFFSFLYVDNRALNRLESRMETLLDGLKPDDRLISSVDGAYQVRATYQMAARAAIGRCWYYGNYEPGSGVFRVRCRPGNRITICSWDEQQALEAKYYRVKPDEAPLHHLTYCGNELCIQRLESGVEVKPASHPNPLPAWW